jgi:hypothetical protein
MTNWSKIAAVAVCLSAMAAGTAARAAEIAVVMQKMGLEPW